jgi:murein DD-endopeptidase MepM/ murein hydrolase activator NlpD
VEDIKYTCGIYLSEYILDPSVIVETLLGNSKEDIYYTIEDGDSLSLVAEISNLTMDELLTLNPSIADANLCHTGDSLLIQQAEPFLNVEYTKSISKESEIPYETITQEDDTLPLGESRIITQGVNGTMNSITEVKYLNDVEVSSTTLEPQIVIEPISQVVSIGTAEPEPSTTTDSDQVAVSLSVGEFISPIDSSLGYISDTFISDRNHKGIDIASAYGTEIQASASGKVISSGWNSGGYGYMVVIDHGSGYVTLYAHMSEVLVDVGQYVSTGETIGKVGSTGDSTGNHLHFELRLDNVCVNPQDYLIGLPN